MNEYFETILLWTINRLEGDFIDSFNDASKVEKNFLEIYPFTTENIAGYINEFNLKNRSLLTVGSSSDQSINASLLNCFDQTIYDVCPFTKYYFNLKKAGLITLKYQEFLEYFSNSISSNTYVENTEMFNLKTYIKLVPVLRLLDYESYLFWDELFNSFSNKIIRKRLFKNDEERVDVLKKCNLYLKNEYFFEQTKSKIKKLYPKFIIGDIYKCENIANYDNIFLSNLASCNNSVEDYKIFINKISKHLKENGTMLVTYLFQTERHTKYQERWSPIYNLEKTEKLLKNYISLFKVFTGTTGYRLNSKEIKDSAIIYHKTKRRT